MSSVGGWFVVVEPSFPYLEIGSTGDGRGEKVLPCENRGLRKRRGGLEGWRFVLGRTRDT